ncbi:MULTISPECIES: hypothetical protein [Mammaliicoccus]|nr:MULTISPECIES: hypothetical protein [unclassified Mammaliicoccus]
MKSIEKYLKQIIQELKYIKRELQKSNKKVGDFTDEELKNIKAEVTD